ncbi:MAG TPA: autotransporter domain-containing protein [Rhodocyclaceae bacterium]|nr:autotransporter domain-containing protein [Rhodocyclaceae bacterium]
MNKTHRTVWSEARQSYIVTHEKAAARGKPSSVSRAVAHTAVVAAIAAMGAAHATTNTIDGTNSRTSTYSLTNGESLVVASNGSIIVTSPYAILAGSVTGTVNGTVTGTVNAGFINNSGSISGRSYGIYQSHSTLTGGLTNSGSISSCRNGVGTCPNSGSFSGSGGDAISLQRSILIGDIDNSGTLHGWNKGIELRGTTQSGKIQNSGVIVGHSYYGIGIVSASSLSGGIVNRGQILSSYTAGVEVNRSTVSGGITNSGVISNDGALYSGGDSVRVERSLVNGGVTNSGTIAGLRYGIYVLSNGTLTGGLTNSGTIAGYNAGTIGGSVAGTIAGIFAVAVDGTSSLDSIVIAGNNTARFIGGVYAPNTPMSIASGATYTLRGDDRFIVSGFTNAGTLKIDAAGTGTNTGTITGDFTNTGTFSPKVSSMTHYGQLAVTGTAVLGGALYVDASAATGLVAGTLAGVLTAGTVSGSFASHGDNSSLFDFVPVYNGNQVDLRLEAAAAGGVTTAVNGAGAGAAAGGAANTLDQIFQDNTNPITALFVPVSTQGNGAIANAVKQTLPIVTGGSAAVASGALTSINRVIQSRVEANRGMSSGDEFYGDKKVWLKPFASWAEQGDKNGIAGYKGRVGGFALGADAEVNSQTRVGVAFAYGNAKVTSKSTVAPQTTNVDIYQLIGYGSYSLDERTEANFQADFGNNKNEGRRDIPFAGVRASSSYDSFTTHVGAGLSRSYALSEVTTFVPSVRIDYTNIYDKAYRESGAGALNLIVNSRTSDELVYAIDGKVAHKLNEANTVIANLGWAYDDKAKASSVTAAYAGASGLGFTTKGATPSKDSIRAGFGYVHAPKDGPELTARYDVELKDGFKNETVSAKARWAF